MLKIYKYSNNFPTLFEKEKKKLKQILGDICEIEHIGSTAIKGTDGKGIIDIMLAFEKQNDIDKAIELLKTEKYFLSNDNTNRKGRIFMSSSGLKESDFGDIHLHLITKDNEGYLNAKVFRDYLTEHSKEKKEYIDLKYKLFESVEGDRKKYTKLKSDFIEKIISLAKLDYVKNQGI